MDVSLDHLALNHADPIAVAAWYVEHLGFSVVSGPTDPPISAHFLRPPGGGAMLEIFHLADPEPPDYRALAPLQLHLAVRVDDLDATIERLRAAGAEVLGEPVDSPSGGRAVMLRDPTGLPLQLVSRPD